MSRKISVLGSTGSVGTSVLEVVRAQPGRLEVVALAAGGNDPELLLRQVEETRPRLVAVASESSAHDLRRRLPAGVELAVGVEGVEAAATHPDADLVVAAIVGAAGARSAWAAVGAGKDLALANKEALVVGGRLLTERARRTGAAILPIDSEHAALHQALRCGSREQVRSLTLTASGGPFWRREVGDLAAVTVDEALDHPTWSMGAKITIDSATMMNKGLELIEAHHLFAIPVDRIAVVIHPQSIIHSLVEFCDGSWIAQLSLNDMVFPVQYALAYPDRWPNELPQLDLAGLRTLEFYPYDPAVLPAVELARAAVAAGESAPIVLNAANEAAVAAFLGGKIGFPEITGAVEAVLAEHEPCVVGDVEEALEWDGWARRRADERFRADSA